MDNLSAVLMGFLALILMIVVINIINAMMGNSQRKKARSTGRDRVRGDLDRVNDEYHGTYARAKPYRNSPQIQPHRRAYTQSKRHVNSASYMHSYTQQEAQHTSASHTNHYSSSRGQH